MNWVTFVVFPVVGAVIGAVTNQVAIRMLFRPYRPVVLWGHRLPFTPGLIPRQRGNIAKNIAETFESNLLSGEDIHSLITGDRIRAAIEDKVAEFLDGLGPLAAFFDGLGNLKAGAVEKILEAVEEVATIAVAGGGEMNVSEKIEQRINEMDIEALENLVLGFSRKQFRYITFFGGIIGALIGLVQAVVNLLMQGQML